MASLVPPTGRLYAGVRVVATSIIDTQTVRLTMRKRIDTTTKDVVVTWHSSNLTDVGGVFDADQFWSGTPSLMARLNSNDVAIVYFERAWLQQQIGAEPLSDWVLAGYKWPDGGLDVGLPNEPPVGASLKIVVPIFLDDLSRRAT